MTYNQLSKGIQCFSKLRNINATYVDKTGLIFELVRGRGRYMLVRPRRFGKSLLVSTIGSLFADGLKHFNGLAIEKLWNDRTYDVVHMDFSETVGAGDPDKMTREILYEIRSAFEWIGFACDENCQVSLLDQLSVWLAARPSSSIVLLIDECDTPLTKALDRPEMFAKAREMLNDFYSVIKRNEECLRFFFMTGITKLGNDGLFKSLDLVTDISYDPKFGELIGFTKDEIRQTFGPWIDAACCATSLPRRELLEKLQKHYGGYCFDSQASKHVSCPWSILSFFAKQAYDFDPHWFLSGGHSGALRPYLTKLLQQNVQYVAGNVPISADGRDPHDLDNQGAVAILHQAGYLTIRSAKDGILQLGYPNKDVASSMSHIYSAIMTKDRRDSPWMLKSALIKADTGKAAAVLKDHLESLDSSRYTIEDEATFRALFRSLLDGTGADVNSEPDGTALHAFIGNTHWIFELGFAKSRSEVPGLLDKVFYRVRPRLGEGLPPAGRLICMALVFDTENRTLAAKHFPLS